MDALSENLCFNLSSSIQECLMITLNEESVPDGVKCKLRLSSSNSKGRPDVITADELRLLHTTARNYCPGFKNLYFHELICGAEIQLPKPVIPERNPELEARIKQLKAKLAEREYKEMTKNVDSQWRADEKISLSSEVQGLKTQLIAVFNFVLTVGCAFVFGYKAVQYTLPVPHIPIQVFIGLTLALVVACADLYFIIKSL